MPGGAGVRDAVATEGKKACDARLDGWDWVWMTAMMVGWVVLIAAAVYVAVKLAHRSPTGHGGS